MSRLVPPHIRAAPSADADGILPTLYDPEDFATLYHADKERAIALVAAMSEPQDGGIHSVERKKPLQAVERLCSGE